MTEILSDWLSDVQTGLYRSSASKSRSEIFFCYKTLYKHTIVFLDDNICIFAFVKGKYCKTQNDAAKIVPVQPEDDRTGHLLVAFPLQEKVSCV